MGHFADHAFNITGFYGRVAATGERAGIVNEFRKAQSHAINVLRSKGEMVTMTKSIGDPIVQNALYKHGFDGHSLKNSTEFFAAAAERYFARPARRAMLKKQSPVTYAAVEKYMSKGVKK